MLRRVAKFLRREKGGIATYVAQSVMILAVLAVAFLVIAATNNLGRFIIDRIQNFMSHAPK